MDAGTIGFCERDGSERDEAGRVNFLFVSILFTLVSSYRCDTILLCHTGGAQLSDCLIV